jgi:uncharacterized protein YbjQ (UPF0145 family)
MRFFRRPSEEQRAAAAQERERAARSLASLEASGLPLRAQERLARQATSGGSPGLWTSDLSVGEFLATRTLSFEALGQVLGASIYHIPATYQNVVTGELSAFSQALYEARDRALGRLRQEAATLGAHGVVGVRLEHKAYEWGSNLLDFTAIGTAVRLPGAAPLKQPFLSDLSGQEALTLLRTGYVPVGVAVGCCAYYVTTTTADGWQQRGRYNNEMRRLTSAVYKARHIAMDRMVADGRAMGANGIVGSDVHLRAEEWMEDHIVEFTAVGTAVAAIKGRHQPVDVPLVLDVGQPSAVGHQLLAGS